MNTFAILGSGFGLYGYLPALIQGGVQTVFLPQRYQAKFTSRNELKSFEESIQWKQDDQDAVSSAQAVVLAITPFLQNEWIPELLNRKHLHQFILEKPLAQTPEESCRRLGDMIRSKKIFRIGYTFHYTPWAQTLLNELKSQKTPISIEWNFLAHHYLNNLHNWKRSHATGGGAIRFYGIQLIALLAELGYSDVIFSEAFGETPDDLHQWVAVFQGTSLPECKISINSKASSNEFMVSSLPTANLKDPFDTKENTNNKLDRRVPLLMQIYKSLDETQNNPYNWYHMSHELWQKSEARCKFKIK